MTLTLIKKTRKNGGHRAREQILTHAQNDYDQRIYWTQKNHEHRINRCSIYDKNTQKEIEILRPTESWDGVQTKNKKKSSQKRRK